MKHKFLCLILLLLGLMFYSTALFTDSKEEEKLFQVLKADTNTSQEQLTDTLVSLERTKVYFQLDKPLYKPGETIWFKPYLFSGKNLTQRKHYYNVELVNARGGVAQSIRIYPDSKTQYSFELAKNVAGGEYKLRVKGREKDHEVRKFMVSTYQAPRFKKEIKFLQESYVAGNEVSALFTVKRDTGEAYQNAPLRYKVVVDEKTIVQKSIQSDRLGLALIQFKLPAKIEEGNGSLMVTVKDGSFQELKSKAIPILVKNVDFALYPEGGTFIANAPNTIFFQAKTNTGKPAEVKGMLLDQQNNVITHFSSYHRGFGKFSFTPTSSQSYKVKLTEPQGIEKEFALPSFDSEGVHLTVTQNKAKGVFLRVYATKNIEGSFACATQGNLIGVYPVALKKGENKVLIPIAEHFKGTYRLTLFDNNRVALAERLVFRNWGKELKIKIQGLKEEYAPREKVALTVSTVDENNKPCEAEIAMAVVNDTILSYADDKTAHLVTQTLLGSEVHGEVFEPNFYFSGKEKSVETLDYLLNTQGWRKFEWIRTEIDYKAKAEELFKQQEVIGATYFLNKFLKQHEGKEAQLISQDPSVMQLVWKISSFGVQDPSLKTLVKFRATYAVPEAPTASGVVREGGEIRLFGAPGKGGARFKNKNEAQPEIKALIVENNVPSNQPKKPVAKVGKIAELKANRGGLAAKKRDIRGMRDEMGGERANFLKEQLVRRRVFSKVNYANNQNPQVRTDFRETIHWEPNLKTDKNGQAKVEFYLSDSITSFRITSEGLATGAIAHSEEILTSVLPFYLQTKTPSEVTIGDRIDLPITLNNRSAETIQARVSLYFQKTQQRTEVVSLAPKSNKTIFYPLTIQTSGVKNVRIEAQAKGFKDSFQRNILAVERGFLMSASVSGILDEKTRLFEIDLPQDTILSSVSSEAKFYPSPLSTMMDGLTGMLRRPGGCFEQTTSSNYPNTMIMTYMKEYNFNDPKVWAQANEFLSAGYKRLIGFECKEGGFEWFGNGKGHEGLTAMGLLQFQDMKNVFSGVEDKMMKRTGDWLKSRINDKEGGYHQNPRFLHSWGCGKEITDAYIIYCLSEAGFSDLERQVDYITKVANKNEDPYILGLVCNALYKNQRNLAQAEEFLDLLAKFQEKDGSFLGKTKSVTCSTGKNLTIETTSLAIMALIKANKHRSAIEAGVRWLNEQRSGYGNYGATQATVLALKALTEYTLFSKRPTADGKVTLALNNVRHQSLEYTKDDNSPLAIEKLGPVLQKGKNSVQLSLESKASMPFSYNIEFRVVAPRNSKECQVGIENKLEKDSVKMGESVALKVKIWNKSKEGIPMSVARVGFPGGLNFQLEELKELKKKGIVDFYETKPREIIFYFTQMNPEQVKEFTLNLMAEVPGSYCAEASSAYLYYTDEHEQFIHPLKVNVLK